MFNVEKCTVQHTHTHTHTHDRAGMRTSEHSKLRKNKCFAQGKCNACLPIFTAFPNLSSLQEPRNNFTFFIMSTFLQSIYHKTIELCDRPFMTYMNSTRFGTEVPSSGFHFNKRYVRQHANTWSVPPYKNDKILWNKVKCQLDATR